MLLGVWTAPLIPKNIQLYGTLKAAGGDFCRNCSAGARDWSADDNVVLPGGCPRRVVLA